MLILNEFHDLVVVVVVVFMGRWWISWNSLRTFFGCFSRQVRLKYTPRGIVIGADVVADDDDVIKLK